MNPVEESMTMQTFRELKQRVVEEFLGPKFKGSFRNFGNKRGAARLARLKEILSLGAKSAQEVQDEKKGHHQMYGEVRQEKNQKSFAECGLGVKPTFFYDKEAKAWLTSDENRARNFV